jgi:DNA repair exonuclease SbcCD ATPase subunit
MSKKWESQPVLGEDGEPLKTKTGKAVLKQSYSVLQDNFFEHMRAAGYTDVERGERGSSEEHLTVTQFKVMKEQERLSELQETKTEIQSEIAELQEAHAKESEKLDKAKERIQKQKLDLKRIDEIEAKPTLIGNKVTVDKDDFDMVITAAKKHIAQEKKESALQKALDAAHKLIAELKSTVADLTRKLAAATKELSEYKSVRGQLRTADLEKENDRLRSRLRTYEDVISRNNLWHFFSGSRSKNRNRDDAR